MLLSQPRKWRSDLLQPRLAPRPRWTNHYHLCLRLHRPEFRLTHQANQANQAKEASKIGRHLITNHWFCMPTLLIYNLLAPLVILPKHCLRFIPTTSSVVINPVNINLISPASTFPVFTDSKSSSSSSYASPLQYSAPTSSSSVLVSSSAPVSPLSSRSSLVATIRDEIAAALSGLLHNSKCFTTATYNIQHNLILAQLARFASTTSSLYSWKFASYSRTYLGKDSPRWVY